MEIDPLMPPTKFVLGLGLLTVCASTWFMKVQQTVADPYLDEEFHIRQAQAYCAGRWDIWDPKITTPPGLYVFSSLIHTPFGWDCTNLSLRLLNSVCDFLAIPFVACYILRQQSYIKYGVVGTKSTETFSCHSALNIGLFPLLFFFSALYYTDIMSTFWVLVNHALYLSKAGPDGRLNGSIVTDLMIVNSGLIALSFRQTNIFWVAIFPGGLEVLRALEAESRGAKKDATKGATFREILLRSWRTCEVYEAPAGEAYVEDYIKTAISLLIAALANPVTVVRTLIPYLLLLGSFAAFVVGNGGVVLGPSGDKSNHVATLHLAQMLYIWPCFVFFFPSMLLPGVLEPLVPLGRVSSFIRLAKINNFPRIAVITMVSAITLLIVHFNTIIHPFTLADNRHYVFYVFRWTILRHPMIKYLLTPIYLLSGWAVLRATSGKKSGHDDPRAPALPRPAAPPKSECGTTTTSLVMVWLASTALSLISAPLVEPRYYIMPLITWRLYLLPSETVMEADQHQESRKDTKGSVSSGKQSQQPRRQKASQPSSWIKLLERHNARLWLESLWFLAINMVTGYVFLYNGFAWPQEPGKVQRFMW